MKINEILTNENGLELKLLNGVSIQFDIENGIAKGIGSVKNSKLAFRSGNECIFPEIATPDGMEIDHYKFKEFEISGDDIIIRTIPYFRVGHRMEWAEQAMNLRVNTRSWSKGPISSNGSYMNWVIKSVSSVIADLEYQGFSYYFDYNCTDYKIYQLEEKATWEINGDITGNTFMMRGSCEMPVFKFHENSSYYSGWTMKGIANPYIFQHLPLYTHLQGFTFQFNDNAILITKHTKPSHVRSLYQKDNDSTLLLHFNQYCFNLTDNVKTTEKEILIADNSFKSQTSLYNHFIELRDEVYKGYRKFYNVKKPINRPEAHIETWVTANIEKFPAIIKQLKEWGFNRSYIMPLWRSPETELNPMIEGGRHNYSTFGNMCCPLDLEISERTGGLEGLSEAFAIAKELDFETYMWFGSHFSSLSTLPVKIPDIFARDVTGLYHRNNYSHVLYAVNQNSEGYKNYLVETFRKLKVCGINGVFRDSHLNMAVDTFNYLHLDYKDEREGVTFDRRGDLGMEGLTENDQVLSMFDSEMEIMSRFENELEDLYYVEDLGIFGIPMCGTDYDQVDGNEFIYNDVSTGANLTKMAEHGKDIYTAYFRGLSVRLIYQLVIEPNSYPAIGSIDSWWDERKFSPLLHAYNKIEQYMDKMSLLDDDNGIVWTSASGDKVIFAYKDFGMPLNENYDLCDMLSMEETKNVNNVLFSKLGIYFLKNKT